MARIVIGEPEDEDTVFVADRADIFRAARALVDAFGWEQRPDVIDVVAVARFLTGDDL